MKRAIAIGLATLMALAATWLGLAIAPGPLFAYEAQAGNLVLHARAPLPVEADAVLRDALGRVSRSPLYDAGRTYDVYLCDSVALFTALTATGRGAGLTNPWGTVFLRPAVVEHDRMLELDGRERAGERTLAYTIAHEVTHVMTLDHLGFWRFRDRSAMQTEGYADHVAGVRTGPYARYRALVGYLLEQRVLTVEAMLARRVEAAEVEAMAREAGDAAGP